MAIKFFSGIDLSTVTAGSILKVDSNGVIVAAVDGTDYNTASTKWSDAASGNIYYNSGGVRIGTYQSAVNANAQLHVFDYQTTDPKLLIEDGNTGDASMEFKISTQSYTMGIDNSDADKFVLAASTALGTTNVLEVATAGTAAFQNSMLVKGNITLGAGGDSDYNKLSFVRAGGSGVGAIGWHSDGNFYVAGHPSFGPTAGNDVRVYGFGSDIHIGDSNNGDVITVQRSSGNVGIGTSSPSAKLHVHHNSEEVLRIDSGTTGAIHFFENTTRRGILGYSNGTSISTAADAGDMVLRAESSNKLHLSNGSTVALTVDTGQNVGIGTTSPSEKLHVVGSARVKGSQFATEYDSLTGLIIDNSSVAHGDGVYGVGIEFSKLGNSTVKKAAIVPVGTGADNDHMGLSFQVSQSSTQADPTVESLRLKSGGNISLPQYGAGILKTDSSGNVSLDTSTYLTSINNGNWSGTDLSIANGGTGASTASAARTNLGLGSAATSENSDFVAAGGDTMTGALIIQQGASDQNNTADTTTIPSTTGAEFMRIEGAYTDGRYTTELTKVDRGGNLPLYIRQSKSSANSFVNLARFGDHSNSVHEFEVFGSIKASGGDSGNWNTAYTYSQVGHLPLSGGTVSGAVTLGAQLTLSSFDTGVLRVDSGTVSVDTNTYLTSMPANSTVTSVTFGGVKVEEASDRPGLLEINRDGSDSWSGIMTKFSGTAEWALMGDEDEFGLYDDQNNEWAWKYNENSELSLYHNGSAKIVTKSDGANVVGRLYATGAIQVPYGVAEHKPMIVLSGATNYGLFHTEATNDEFTFDFNGTQKFKFSQDGILTVNGNTVTTGKITNWDTAHGWGNHASAGYLTTASAATSYAPLASPALTGTPTAPTAASTTNTTQIATTAFVQTAVSNLVDSAPGALDTLNELAAALGDDADFSTTVTNSIATKLPLAGGTMTGNILLGANKIAADTTSPTAHIQVGAGTTNTGNRSNVALLGESNSGGVVNALGLVNTAAGTNSNGVALNFHNGNAWSPTGQIIVKQNASGTTTDSGMYFYTYDGGLNNRMTIKNDGTIRFNAYGAGLLKTDSSGNISLDTTSYSTFSGSYNDLSNKPTIPSGNSVIDWTVDQGSTVIHHGNYTNTTYSVGDGGLTQKNFTTAMLTKLDGIATSANNYSHPTFNGDDFSIDTGALTGATVISDLDINITTNGEGHVTDANAAVSTRNLTAANIGAAASSHTHAASDITSGTLDIARIPTVDNKISEFLEEKYAYISNDSNGVFMPMVKGGLYATSTSTVTGALKIKLPNVKTNMMISFHVDIYEYNHDRMQSFQLGGYAYGNAAANWYNTSAICLSDSDNRNLVVTFASNTDATEQYVYIGDTSTTWSYPQVVVRDVLAGYSTAEGEILDPWTISFETTLNNGTTAAHTNNQPIVDGSRIRGAVPLGNGGTGSTTAAGARTNLGLGSLATLSTVNNSNWSGTDLSVANGGTGASTAAGARTNLGLGTAATSATGDFATAAQGTKADNALPKAGGTVTGGITMSSTSTSPKLDMTGHAGASNYNYFLRAANDGGNKAVHFVNGSTRTADGGADAYTIRNDGGKLILGHNSYTTQLAGSVVNTASDVEIIQSDTSNHWALKISTNGSNNSGFWTTDEDVRLLLRDNDGNIRVDLYPDGTSRFYDTLQADGTLNIGDRITHIGDTDTYIKFDTNRVRIVAGNVTKFDSNTTYTGTVQSVTGAGTVSGLSLSDDGDSVDPTLTLSGTISISSANITDVAANADATPSWVPATDPNYLTAHPSITEAADVNNSNGTVIQDLTFDDNGHVTSTGSVDLDGRYYTESEMKTFFKRGYIESHSANNLAVGWYTIAQNTGDRALGEFQIWDTNSSRHQSVIFNAAHHFGTDDSNSITVLANSSFSTDVYRYIRIKENGTYDGAAIQVYIDNSTNQCGAAIIGGNAQQSGWSLVDFLPDATAPSQISNWSSATEKTKVDLDNIHSGGIATTGKIYAGGATSQNEVYHKGNLSAGTNVSISAAGVISATDTNTTYTVGDGGLTEKNFTSALKTKLDGIAAGATNVTNNNQLTNGAGYITSFDITTQTDSKYLRSNADDATTGALTIGDGSNQARLILKKADNNVSNHIEFYNGTTRVGEIGVQDTTWLRINQATNKNIYTPRYIRADNGFYVDGTSKGINGSGNFIGGTITGASDANVSNWDTAYGWGNHADANYLTSMPANSTVTSVTFGGVKVEEASDRPGLLEINRDGSDSWSGIMTKFSGTAEWALMGDENEFGLYDDQNNEWAWRYVENSELSLYHNGSAKIVTKSDGANVVGRLYATGGITSDGNSKFYNWRAVDNTSNSSNQYFRIARVTSSQSSRFMITLAGRSTSYSDSSLPAMGHVVGQLNNDNNYDVVFYNHSTASSEVVTEVGIIDVSSTVVDVYVRVGQYAELTATGHTSDGAFAVYSNAPADGTSSAPSGYTAVTEYTSYNSGNLTAGTNVSISSGGVISATDTNTTYTVGDGGLTQKNFTTAMLTKLDGIEASADVTDTTNVVAALTAGSNISIAANGTISATDTNTTYSAYDGVNSGLVPAGDAPYNDGSYFLNGNGEWEIPSDTNTTYSAGAGLDLTGTAFSVESNLAGDVHTIGRDGNDKYVVNTANHAWYLDGALDMRLNSSGQLDVDGDVIAYSTVTNSDRRLKTDIETIEGASEKVSKLRGVEYTWDHGKHKGKRDIGLIAQEVEEVVPEVVSEGELLDGTTAKRVDYAKLVGLLVEANKEQQDLISRLEKRIVDLENKL